MRTATAMLIKRAAAATATIMLIKRAGVVLGWFLRVHHLGIVHWVFDKLLVSLWLAGGRV